MLNCRKCRRKLEKGLEAVVTVKVYEEGFAHSYQIYDLCRECSQLVKYFIYGII